MEKRTIRYIKGNREIVVGLPAIVTALDHPKFNGLTDVVTGEVIDYDERNGMFETPNSIWVPADYKG